MPVSRIARVNNKLMLRRAGIERELTTRVYQWNVVEMVWSRGDNKCGEKSAAGGSKWRSGTE